MLLRFQIENQQQGPNSSDNEDLTYFLENHITNLSSPDSHGIAEHDKQSIGFRIGDIIEVAPDTVKYKVVDFHFEYYSRGFNNVSGEPSLLIRVILRVKN